VGVIVGILVGLAAVVVVYVLVGLWMRRHPSAMPYAVRFFLAFPRRALHRRRLLEVLTPKPGERVLEIGPGAGYYTFDVAQAVGTGRVEVLDLQQAFLDHVARGAKARDLNNIGATLGDASSLPYENDSFDALFLVSVLGEIPDEQAALREFARVLKPGGRLVVGESLPGGDPHAIFFASLRRRVEPVGFRFDRRLGSSIAYFAAFRAKLIH
jgi:ubiquinone/menaquinone biosynthesis C-methylase UbiE